MEVTDLEIHMQGHRGEAYDDCYAMVLLHVSADDWGGNGRLKP